MSSSKKKNIATSGVSDGKKDINPRSQYKLVVPFTCFIKDTMEIEEIIPHENSKEFLTILKKEFLSSQAKNKKS